MGQSRQYLGQGGLSRMTHVAEPLGQLGAMMLEDGRRRVRAERIAALGGIERMLASVGMGLFLSAAAMSFSPHLGAAWERAKLVAADLLPRAREAVMAQPAGRGGKATVVADIASLATFIPVAGAAEQLRSRASMLALAGERLPADIAALRETQVAQAVTPPVEAALPLSEVPGDVVLLGSVQSVTMSGLPAGSDVSLGAEVAPGVWAMALTDLASLKVGLPAQENKPVTASVEINAEGDAAPVRFGLVVPPKGSTSEPEGAGADPRARLATEDLAERDPPRAAPQKQKAVKKVRRPEPARAEALPWRSRETKAATDANIGANAWVSVPAVDDGGDDGKPRGPAFGIGKSWGYVAGH